MIAHMQLDQNTFAKKSQFSQWIKNGFWWVSREMLACHSSGVRVGFVCCPTFSEELF